MARRYSDAEIARLLERAANLQARTVGDAAGGLTLEELRGVALEAGIDPDMLSQAAKELEESEHRAAPKGSGKPAASGPGADAGSVRALAPSGSEQNPPPHGGVTRSTGPLAVESEEPKRIFGHPTAWVETADLPVSLSAGDTERLVGRVEASLSTKGSLVQTGRVAQWLASRHGYGTTVFQVEPLPHGSRLRLTVDMHQQGQSNHAAGIGFGMVAGALLGMVGGDADVALVATAGGGLLGHLTSRAAWRYTANRWRRRVNDVMSALCGDAMRHGRPLPAPPAGGSTDEPPAAGS